MASAIKSNTSSPSVAATELNDFSDLLPIASAAELLPSHITTETLRSWIRVGFKGKFLASTRLGSRICVRPAAIRKFIEDIQA